MATVETRLKTFDIRRPDGQTHTNQLYANGRHQCLLSLDIVKQVRDADGFWVDEPLTTAEILSAEVTRFGSPGEPLGRGWSCDREKNKYDLGLWRYGLESQQGDDDSAATSLETSTEFRTPIARYMRFDPGGAITSERLMGRITVGGKVYTTNGTYQDVSFYTSVYIQPVRPYHLSVAQLSAYTDAHAFEQTVEGNKIDIDVYYYVPPLGLRFVENRGLDAPLPVRQEGYHFESCFTWHKGSGIRKKGGVVVRHDVAGMPLRLSSVQLYGGYDPEIPFNKYNTIMRAIRFDGWIDNPNGERDGKWRLWDNYGCEHVFRIEQADSFNFLELKDTF